MILWQDRQREETIKRMRKGKRKSTANQNLIARKKGDFGSID